MDLVVNCKRMPAPGETLIGRKFSTLPGGKGANQAVAAARLGGGVSMIGCLGDDAFGRTLRTGLEHEGIETQQVKTVAGVSSGVALIQVDELGENAITVVPGANSEIRLGNDVDAKALIQQADVMLIQLEIPLAEVVQAITIAKSAGVLTILDPAPAPTSTVPGALYAVAVLSPNQHEAESLTGVKVIDYTSATHAARELKSKGAENVVIKMGGQGALAMDASGNSIEVSTFDADVIDTTAAGDAFTAALGIGLGSGMSLEEATRMGCAAGSLAVQTAGAQDAMPDWSTVMKVLG